jgi:hypothetical protein
MSEPSNNQKTGTTLQPQAADYGNVLAGVVELLDTARRTSARVVNTLMTATYWEIGRRICHPARCRVVHAEQMVALGT